MKKTKKRILLLHLILILSLYFTVICFFNGYNPYLNLVQRSMQQKVLLGYFLLSFSGSLLILGFSRENS